MSPPSLGQRTPVDFCLTYLHVGIVGARRELAEPALLEHQVRLALRALLVEDLVRLGGRQALLRRDDLPRRLALRVAGAGQELTEAPALERHRLAAVLAVLFDLPALGVRLGRSRARACSRTRDSALHARNMPNLPALITIGEPHLSQATFGIGLDALLEVDHFLGGALQVLLELLVEARRARTCSRLPVLDLVELFLELARVVDVEDVVERRAEQLARRASCRASSA